MQNVSTIVSVQFTQLLTCFEMNASDMQELSNLSILANAVAKTAGAGFIVESLLKIAGKHKSQAVLH